MKKMVNGEIVDMSAKEVEEFEREAEKFRKEIALTPASPTYMFRNDITYHKGDVAQKDGGIFRLKTERARGIDPTDKTYWENISLADLIKEISKENEQ